MSNYRLNEGDGGYVELRSGRWQWLPIRIESPADNECVLQRLVFLHAEESGSTMAVDIPPSVDRISEEELHTFSRDVNARTIATERGRFQVFGPFPGAPNDDWTVRQERGGVVRVEAHLDGCLADLTREEMEMIVAVAY